MVTPGYYKTNYRALRFREIVRTLGWERGLRYYFLIRHLPPGGGIRLPGLWAETECKREDLSEAFWAATKPHRKDFEELGFIECRYLKVDGLQPSIRDRGGISYLDPTCRYFAQLLYHKVYRPARRQETTEIVIAFTAVFEEGHFSCTNNKKTFDSVDTGEVIRLKSYDAKFIYQQFLHGLQQHAETPRHFPDVESLRQWYDARQNKIFEDRIRRGLYIPMTDAEVAAARAQLANPVPPVYPQRPRGFQLKWALWIVLLGCILLLEILKHHALPYQHAQPVPSNIIEFRGQQFKMSQAYADYEDYKDDPDNLDTNEFARIEQVMTTAEVPKTFKDRNEFTEFMMNEMEFPGYGMTMLGANAKTDDGTGLEVQTVEIPHRDKARVIIMHDTGGKLSLIDDFIYNPATNEIRTVKLEKQTLHYFNFQNQLLREKQLQPQL